MEQVESRFTVELLLTKVSFTNTIKLVKITIYYQKGLLSMANAGPNTNGS